MDYRTLADRTGWSQRTAQRYIAAWAGSQRLPHVPRVREVPTGKRGRPPYHVDTASFEAWRSTTKDTTHG